ncbi:alpha/beta hydrolase family protein [Segetibacter sp. 3557_3]|uniref:alpha/beta hydrolase family protein n=1 Tax=Segetibacter sp. 3557_3 TaxID=2547429 RepID=UPI00140462C4|nr:alpha/beta fold hydrolase [Segetibacter sp. 3557_3]
MKKQVRFVSYFFVFLVFVGCQKDKMDTPPTGSELFVSATSITTIPKTLLQAQAVTAGYGQFVSQIKYDVDFRKIIYKTNYKGNLINVSGLLAIPKNFPGTPSMLSAQHGTMFKYTEAPSNFPAAFTGFELFAAGGFVTVIPDYIGFGVSTNVKHPYYDMQLSGTTVVDMIKATKHYLETEKVAISNRLFLVGYSEGGYVTMAAQKELETNNASTLPISAVAAGAGGYDLTGMLSTIAGAPTYASPAFLALLLQSYNTTYNWNRPYSDFFKEPYASKIPALLDGSKDQAQVNSELTTTTSALFNPTFYANLTVPTAETTLKQALTNNSFLTWVPKSPTRLYHGTNDEAVFYNTTVSTFNRFKAAGANNVEFFPIPNGTHTSSIEPMMLNALPWMLSLDK